ncbi:hypothetical protein ACIQD3_20685 [Peribacillus loiseleuriae]|uniref:hypothetical protein n=1 Tax=Peribacillus loiseleuriae TaxID=1679170 RepID=UPI00380BD9E4
MNIEKACFDQSFFQNTLFYLLIYQGLLSSFNQTLFQGYKDGNVYQIYWNLFNMFEPSEIEMTVDNSRYCKHFLQRWTSSADSSKCKHEYVDDIEKAPFGAFPP